jgi:hypothetical protein
VDLSPPFGPVVRYRLRVTDACGGELVAGPFSFGTDAAAHPPLRINELNQFAPPVEGEAPRAWVELYNAGTEEIDLSGIHLSDAASAPRRGRLPDGLRLAPGAALVVLTEGGDLGSLPRVDVPWDDAASGTVFLIDSDVRGACLLDAAPFDIDLLPGDSLGRIPDGTGELVELPAPSPGAPNGGSAITFVRGDSNGDLRVNVTDMIRLLAILLSGDARFPECEDALDADDSGGVNATDAVYIGASTFRMGPAPPPPFPAPGTDPTPDVLAPCGD